MEWVFFLLILGLVDLFQFSIEWIAILFSLGTMLIVTSIINVYIDIAVAFIMPLYLRLRGQKVMKPGQLGGLLGTFLLEMIPGLDELPLWTLDGLYYMFTIKAMYKKEDLLAKVPLGAVVEAKLNKLDKVADVKRADSLSTKEQGSSQQNNLAEKNQQANTKAVNPSEQSPASQPAQQQKTSQPDTQKRRIQNVTRAEEFLKRREEYNKNLQDKQARNEVPQEQPEGENIDLAA